MKNKKIYIVIVIVLIVYFAILYFTWGKDNIKEGKYSTTMLIGDNTIWNYSGKQWLNITNKKTIDTLNWQKFNVFVDNKNLGENYIWHDDKWYVFDDDKKAIPFTGKLFAFKSNYDISIFNYQEENIEDLTYVEQALMENDLSTSAQFTVKTKTSLDIDNDGIKEDFYIISNAFADEFTPNILFSIVFMVKNGEIYYIYNDISQNNSDYSECKPYFNYFIDLNEDNVYEIILSCGKYSIAEEVNMLYKFEDDEFKIIISNQ